MAKVNEQQTSVVETMEDEMAAIENIQKQAQEIRWVVYYMVDLVYSVCSGGVGGNRTWTANGAPSANYVRPVSMVRPVKANGDSVNNGNTGGYANDMAPPANYVCYRCGTAGHFIQNCPTNGNTDYDQHRVKKKTGMLLDSLLFSYKGE